MYRLAVHAALFVFLVWLLCTPSAMAHGRGSVDSPWPRVVATVTSLHQQGMATIQTVDGITYEVIRGTAWHVGDTVECEHVARARVLWQTLSCRKTS